MAYLEISKAVFYKANFSQKMIFLGYNKRSEMAENVRLRRSTAIELEAARFLQEQGVESGQRIMCDKRAAGEINTQDGLLVFSTNVYGLMMKTIKVYRYAVTVIGYLRSEKKVELTKPVSGE